MSKTIRSSTPTATSRLVERQRRLWAHAEAIEKAQKQGRPLPEDVSEWLHRALRTIACGKDANLVFDVVPEKQGVRRDGFASEMRQKMANSYIAAATQNSPKSKRKRTPLLWKSTALQCHQQRDQRSVKTGTRQQLTGSPHLPLGRSRYFRYVLLW